MLPESATEEIQGIIAKYPSPASALLPALHVAQDSIGYISEDAIVGISSLLELPPAHVRGVASFHDMFRSRSHGRHLVQLCTNVSCMLAGAEDLLIAIKERFGLEPGGTTEDKRFTLLDAECIGACEEPPAMLVDSDVHTGLTAESIIEILERYG
jgi:NADH-quinone oxidoreductase E subunit